MYVPPYVGPAGLSIPQYSDILDLYTAAFQQLYGPSVYLGIDSADYQLLSILALSAADSQNTAQLAYNNTSPVTAVGAGLDISVAYNGLIREAPSYSTCVVTLTGVAGTIIANGKVFDTVPGQGYLWDLPTSVTIGSGGTVSTTVTCEIIGSVNALVGQLTLIATPTSGWVSVTNPSPAVLGQPVETDSQLRTRQAISTELPSITLLAGTAADVAAVAGVTASLCLENPTGAALSTWPIPAGQPLWYGPAHALTVVAEGGTNLAVATAIYANRGIGCSLNGTTVQQVIDPNSGQPFNVSFYRPTYVAPYVIVNAHALSSAFGATVEAAIQTAVVNYLNNLALGATVSWAATLATAMSAAGNLENPIFDIQSLYIGLSSSPTGIIDLPMANPYNAAEGLTANVTVNSV